MDRQKIVSGRSPKVTRIDAYSPLSVGNGEFAFTADATGLQTFPESYESVIPLCTQAQWGWHIIPADNESGRHVLNELRYDELEIRGRKVPYPLQPNVQEKIYHWLRQNPYRLHLGRVGLLISNENGERAKPEDIKNIAQELDLWEGVLKSEFETLSEKVETRVFCHPDKDILAVKIESGLFKKGALGVEIAFPYASPLKQSADWESPEKHRTEILDSDGSGMLLKRTLDGDVYFADIRFDGDARAQKKSAHRYSIAPVDSDELTLMIAFSDKRPDAMPQYAQAQKRYAEHWESYWERGGMIDFSKCRDPRAFELSRRVVLSQYLNIRRFRRYLAITPLQYRNNSKARKAAGNGLEKQ